MQALKEEVVVKEEKKCFVCMFLNDDGQCLAEKHKCSQDRKDERCKQTEDIFQ